MQEDKGRLFRRKDGKYLIYLPKDLCADTMFPFRDELEKHGFVKVGVKFEVGKEKLGVEPLRE